MRCLLSIILCLWASCSWAFPPGFIGAVTQGAASAPASAFYFDCESDTATAPNIGTSTNFSIHWNAVTSTPAWKTGNYALDLTASDSRILIDMTDFSFTAGSIEYDFSFTGTDTIFLLSGNGTAPPEARYWPQDGGHYYIKFGGSDLDINTTTELTTGTMHHIKLEWDAAGLTVTVDAEVVGTQTRTGTWADTTTLIIGGGNSWDKANTIVDEIYGY